MDEIANGSKMGELKRDTFTSNISSEKLCCSPVKRYSSVLTLGERRKTLFQPIRKCNSTIRTKMENIWKNSIHAYTGQGAIKLKRTIESRATMFAGPLGLNELALQDLAQQQAVYLNKTSDDKTNKGIKENVQDLLHVYTDVCNEAAKMLGRDGSTAVQTIALMIGDAAMRIEQLVALLLESNLNVDAETKSMGLSKSKKQQTRKKMECKQLPLSQPDHAKQLNHHHEHITQGSSNEVQPKIFDNGWANLRQEVHRKSTDHGRQQIVNLLAEIDQLKQDVMNKNDKILKLGNNIAKITDEYNDKYIDVRRDLMAAHCEIERLEESANIDAVEVPATPEILNMKRELSCEQRRVRVLETQLRDLREQHVHAYDIFNKDKKRELNRATLRRNRMKDTKKVLGVATRAVGQLAVAMNKRQSVVEVVNDTENIEQFLENKDTTNSHKNDNLRNNTKDENLDVNQNVGPSRRPKGNFLDWIDFAKNEKIAKKSHKESFNQGTALASASFVAKMKHKTNSQLNTTSFELERDESNDVKNDDEHLRDIGIICDYISDMYNFVKQHKESAILMATKGKTFERLVFEWFLTRSDTKHNADMMAANFISKVNAYKDECQYINTFHMMLLDKEYYLPSTYGSSCIDFYVWLESSIKEIGIGLVYPKYTRQICFLKATVLMRSVYRIFSFQVHASNTSKSGYMDQILKEVQQTPKDAVQMAWELGLTSIENVNQILEACAFLVAPDELKKYNGSYYQPTGMEKKLSIDYFLLIVVELYRHQMNKKSEQLEADYLRFSKRNARKMKHTSPGCLNANGVKEFLASLEQNFCFRDISQIYSCLAIEAAQDENSSTSKQPRGESYSFQCFAYVATELRIFQTNLEELPSVATQLYFLNDDTELNRLFSRLNSFWNSNHGHFLTIPLGDANPFVRETISKKKEEIELLLQHKKEPKLTLIRMRQLLQICWNTIGHRALTHNPSSTTPSLENHAIFQCLDTDELSLMARVITSIPATVPKHLQENWDAIEEASLLAETNATLVDESIAVDDVIPLSFFDQMLTEGSMAGTSIEVQEQITNNHRGVNSILIGQKIPLYQVFLSYATCLPSKKWVLGMSLESFTSFIHDMSIFTGSHKGFTTTTLHELFVQIARKKGMIGSKNVAVIQRNDMRISFPVFLELLVHMALLLQQGSMSSNPEGTIPESICVSTEIVVPVVSGLRILVDKFILPNIYYKHINYFQLQLASDAVCRVLQSYRTLLHELFSFYADMDLLDDESRALNHSEFSDFLKDYDILIAVPADAKDPWSATLTESQVSIVFSEIQNDEDASQLDYSEFSAGILAISQLKNANVFLPWDKKLGLFLMELANKHELKSRIK